MNYAFCDELLQYQDWTAEAKDPLYSSYILNCVFNAFSSFTAIMLNILTIHAMRKTPSLSKPLKTLLLSLAVSDLGVGLLVQPLYIALLVSEDNHTCAMYAGSFIIIWFFAIASFLGILAITVDRFLAIHFHLRYQEIVTYKRVVAVELFIADYSLYDATQTKFKPCKYNRNFGHKCGQVLGYSSSSQIQELVKEACGCLVILIWALALLSLIDLGLYLLGDHCS
ncbi:olfactory receptor 51A7-like [Oculina patagonica]